MNSKVSFDTCEFYVSFNFINLFFSEKTSRVPQI